MAEVPLTIVGIVLVCAFAGDEAGGDAAAAAAWVREKL